MTIWKTFSLFTDKRWCQCVSLSLQSHPAVHCDPVHLAGSDGPRHTQAGSQGWTGTSPRPTWTLEARPVGLMPARTDGGLCLPDRGLFGEKDERGWPFFTKWCSNFSLKFRLCCLTVAERRRVLIHRIQTAFLLLITVYLLLLRFLIHANHIFSLQLQHTIHKTDPCKLCYNKSSRMHNQPQSSHFPFITGMMVKMWISWCHVLVYCSAKS